MFKLYSECLLCKWALMNWWETSIFRRETSIFAFVPRGRFVVFVFVASGPWSIGSCGPWSIGTTSEKCSKILQFPLFSPSYFYLINLCCRGIVWKFRYKGRCRLNCFFSVSVSVEKSEKGYYLGGGGTGAACTPSPPLPKRVKITKKKNEKRKTN